MFEKFEKWCQVPIRLSGEIPFRDAHGRGDVDIRFRNPSSRALLTGALQRTLGLDGAITLIGSFDRQLVTRKLNNEYVDRIRHLAGRTICMQWHADDEPRRPPFGDDLIDALVVDAIFAVRDRADRARGCRDILPDRNADAAQSVVKCEDRLGQVVLRRGPRQVTCG